ncbi:MAG: flagellar hook assembly protein FlgD [Rhodocyclales bacterium]|nr:flagellar hook assembly protein FlgD [Rhodocyclales bacterium]
MAVNTIGNNATTTQALIDASKATNTASSSNVMTDAQNRFLKLLTTQLKNQDPLNPMDNAQMTSQLAQISTVDGIEKLNATLQKLVASSVDGEAMQAANLVGRQVMIAGSGLQLGDSGAVGGVELASAADQVVVTIKDPNGLVMKTMDLGNLDAGIHNFTWDGTTDAGAQAVNGSYSIAVTARRGTEKVTASALQLSGVSNINRSTQGVTLNLGSLGLVTLSDLKQIF